MKTKKSQDKFDKKGKKVNETVNNIKSYDEKVSDYEKHFDSIGMHDPSTEAAIAQMKTATLRSGSHDVERAPDLVERDRVRENKNKEVRETNPGDVKIGDKGKTRRQTNEELSGVVAERQEHDIRVQEGKEPKPITGTNRSQKKTSR